MVGHSFGGSGPALLAVNWAECGLTMLVLAARFYTQASGLSRLGWDLVWVSVATVRFAMCEQSLRAQITITVSGDCCINPPNSLYDIRHWKSHTRYSPARYCLGRRTGMDLQHLYHNVHYIRKVRRRCSATKYPWPNTQIAEDLSSVCSRERFCHQLHSSNLDIQSVHSDCRVVGSYRQSGLSSIKALFIHRNLPRK